jgi:hypothetical protein
MSDAANPFSSSVTFPTASEEQPWNKASLDVNVQDGLKKLFQKAFAGV